MLALSCFAGKAEVHLASRGGYEGDDGVGHNDWDGPSQDFIQGADQEEDVQGNTGMYILTGQKCRTVWRIV